MMQRRWTIAGAFVVALLVLLPLRLVLIAAGLDGRGLSARSVSGSMWSGRMAAAQWRGLGLGDVETRVSPLGLASGALRFNLSGDKVRGDAFMRRGGGGIGDVTGHLAVTGIGSLPLRGVDLENVSIGFRDGQCVTAAGRMTVQPGGVLARFDALGGDLRCDGKFLLAPMASAGGEARIDLRIGADGDFRAHIDLQRVDEAARPGLVASGFQATPQGLALDMEGSL